MEQPPPRAPRTMILQSVDPPRVAGGWTVDALETAGGIPFIAASDRSAQAMTWEEIGQADPDAILVAIPTMDVDAALGAIDELNLDPLWLELRALRRGIVIAVDGRKYFDGTPESIADATRLLAYCLQGERSGVVIDDPSAYQEVFWPGEQTLELPPEYQSWAKERRHAWLSALNMLQEHARRRADSCFEQFQSGRHFEIGEPDDVLVIERSRNASNDLTDHEEHYLHKLFSRLNTLAYSSRLKRRVGARLEGPPLSEEHVIEVLADLMAAHDPMSLMYYPNNVDEYRPQAKAVAASALRCGVAGGPELRKIVWDVFNHYFDGIDPDAGVMQDLVDEVGPVLAHYQTQPSP